MRRYFRELAALSVTLWPDWWFCTKGAKQLRGRRNRPREEEVLAAYLSHDFVGEIFVFLLDAFANFKAFEGYHFGTGISQQFFN